METKKENLVVLASQSKNRRELLESLKVNFTVIPSNIDEEKIISDTLREKARILALLKARNVAKKTSGIIVAADTFSVYAGKQYHKPKDLEDARKMMKELSGKKGCVLTGICIIDSSKSKEISEINVVSLQCKKLTEKEINHYISTRPVTEWAAAYNPLDNLSIKIFTPIKKYPYRIEYYGIGIETLTRELKNAGVYFDPSAAIAE